MQVNLDSTRMALVNDTVEAEMSPGSNESNEKQYITQIEELQDTIKEQDTLIEKQQKQLEKATQAIQT